METSKCCTNSQKKNNKEIVNNYRPISLLPIFGKIFEKIIFESLYSYLIDNCMITPKQSGFIKGDSTINQLLSISQKIHEAFDCDIPLEVYAIFLDISKAFDKVWHPGLLFKLKQLGIDDAMFNILESFLAGRCQRTVINGKISNYRHVEAGVPQGSVLGPLLFLVYINDLIKHMKSDARIFADDTSLFETVKNRQISISNLEHDLQIVQDWGKQWRMSFNPDPTKPPVLIIFSTKRKSIAPVLFFNGIQVKTLEEHKHLGLTFDSKLKFHSHITGCIKKSKRILGSLRLISKYLPRSALDRCYKSFVRSKLEYGDVIYHKCPFNKSLMPLSDTNMTSIMRNLESIQYKASLIVTGAWHGTSRSKLYNELGWESLNNRRWFKQMCLFYKIVSNKTPTYLKIFLNDTISPRNDFQRPFFTRTNKYMTSFFPSCVYSWNNVLTGDHKNVQSLNRFKTGLIKLIRPARTRNFGIDSSNDLKYLTQLRLELNSLKANKFRHNFNDTNDPFCNEEDGIEDTYHFLVACKKYIAERKILFRNIFINTGLNLLLKPDSEIQKILLYGDNSLSDEDNKSLLTMTIKYICSSKRLESFT